MLYNELEQGDILSGGRWRLALLAYTDILLCSIWAIRRIRQTPVDNTAMPTPGATARVLLPTRRSKCGRSSRMISCILPFAVKTRKSDSPQKPFL